ncbi:sugar ABC transporter ATP-binding protein [Nakamurella flavida]|uniref:Sugar ABC transporter ATP-binding protein n=1 Tax=Nakamurella flavida TaxID=363630 RepID=A0A938YPA7_9ACTN|nr:sugar ABC transporter ATP-binding protein [Nakamurella flavida]MBM9476723.1 sugar ABC transporter ATP-binding protein [Nakamurella flavida]MDP9778839.1 ribose transport system ATP-binding protein [Nakamurella flavida]
MSLKLSGIEKTFNGIPALVDVDIELLPGQVHALLGENGAGKSTLIKIMSGVHQPTSGTITLDGEPVRFTGPLDAVERGISVVHQERNLAPDLSVAENVFLNRLPHRFGLVDRRKLTADAEYWLDLVGLHVDLRQPAGRLSPGQGQLLEVARALARESRILLLDEPTASIGKDEVARLFELVRTLRENGTALLFVSHKLDEVFEIGDRITVIRDGRDVIEGAPLAEVGHDGLIEAMVGREFVQTEFPSRPPHGEVALELRGVSTAFGHRDVDLTVRRGEIVGLYGLVGAGRTELARSIVGLDPVLGGQVSVDGQATRIRTPGQALARHRMAYVSEDRKGEGLILSESIARNAGIAIWGALAAPGGFISSGRTRPAVQPPLETMNVKMRSSGQPVSDLSGGNQQKVSLAKWIAADVDILIVDEPTVGIDVGAKDEIHHLLWRMAAEGKAILLISSDMREIVQLSDRVLVMASGDLCADLPNTGAYDDMSQQVMGLIVRHDRSGASSAASA